MSGIKSLTIKGFKSIRSVEDLELRPLNVLIGANAAGKSNFISFFKLLNEIVEQRLQLYVGQKGGPDALLHYGRRVTPQLEAKFLFDQSGYSFGLVPTADNRLIFRHEGFELDHANSVGPWRSGSAESDLELFRSHPKTRLLAEKILSILQSLRVYHFHDTSDVAKVKQVGTINDSAFLRPDASNLAAFLYRLQQVSRPHYEKIRDTVRLVMPGFDDFLLRPWLADPSGNSIMLEWREQGTDYPFLAHQLSDGTLRFICLATLLLQPEPPAAIIIDEPELGLHPYALTLLASLLRGASRARQIIVATQSVTLVDEFEPEDIIVVERHEGASTFKRLVSEELKEWLQEYSLGQLWTKNVLGGRPSR